MMPENQISEKLALMLKEVHNNEGFRKFMKKITEKINFDKKNILNLNLEKVEMLYINLKNKLTHASFVDEALRNYETSVWLENELRIFIYVLCAHLFLNKITIPELKSHDYSLLQEFFPNKKEEHLEYQVKLLLNKKNIKWTTEESKLFREIMKENQDSNRWNFIAKELFIRSTKKYFKTPKQCRERWINHEDPKKLKGSWEAFEDINLLTSISLFGKKWTLAAHKLNDTRTENNVKNRYNSLIKMAKREYGYDKSEQTLIEILLRKKNGEVQVSYEAANDTKRFEELEEWEKEKIDTTIEGEQSKKCQDNNKQFQIDDKMEIEAGKEIEKEQVIHLKVLTEAKQNTNENDELNFMFEDSAEFGNVEWNGQESHEMFNETFYFMDGDFCFDDVHHL